MNGFRSLAALLIVAAGLPIACTGGESESNVLRCDYENRLVREGAQCICPDGSLSTVVCPPASARGRDGECRCGTDGGGTSEDAAADAVADADASTPEDADDDTSGPEDTTGDTADTASMDADGEGGDTTPADAGPDSGSDADASSPGPAPGEIIVTEFMADPDALSDSDGEWFELYNTTSQKTFDLETCLIDGIGDLGHEIDEPLEIGPGEYVTLARSGSPGFSSGPDYVYGGEFTMTNMADSIRIDCGMTQIDLVSYADWTSNRPAAGSAKGLDPTKLDASANDKSENWCDQTSDQGNGDKGTPGRENDPC